MSRSFACSWQQLERFGWEADNPHSGPQLVDFVLTAPASTSTEQIIAALRETARAHDMLRCAFRRVGDEYVVVVDDDPQIRVVDVGRCASV